MLKRVGVIVVALAFLSLAAVPETLACHRHRRVGYYRPVATSYYRPYAYRGVVGSRYYSPYYRGHSTRNLVLTVAAPAALGAGIGAIAGGGKGAAIGTVAGAGAGTGVAAYTGKQEVVIPAEKVITFTTTGSSASAARRRKTK